MAANYFPATDKLAELVAVINRVTSDKFLLMLTKILNSLGASAGPVFGPEEERQLAALFGLGAPADAGSDGSSSGPSQGDGVHDIRTLVEGCTYLLETAAFHNMKTATFGQALLQMGVAEAQAVAIGNVWTAASGAAVNRLRGKPLGAPYVLQGSSYRLNLGIGSSAATGLRETSAVLDLALGHAAGGGAAPAPPPSEVLSVELDRAALAGLLERLDAIQAQVDSLS